MSDAPGEDEWSGGNTVAITPIEFVELSTKRRAMAAFQRESSSGFNVKDKV